MIFSKVAPSMLGNRIKACVYRLNRAAQYTKVCRKPGTLRILSRFPKLNLSVFEPSLTGSGIRIKGTEVDPTLPHLQFLLRGSEQLGRLQQEAKATLEPLPDGACLTAAGVRLKLQNWEELFIAAEVFAEGVYNVRLGEEFVLIDVGMNVATTSLFFASNPLCLAVYSFELFPRTVDKAKVNLSLNPLLAKKINIVPKGLAARSFSTQLDYIDEFRGSIGINGLPSYVMADSSSLPSEKVTVEFIAASEALKQVVKSHPNVPLLCKLDCEGAEYEILESLAERGLLNMINYFMIEWHQKGGAVIERVLMNSGFDLLSFAPNSSTHSMVYAWRRRTPNGK